MMARWSCRWPMLELISYRPLPRASAAPVSARRWLWTNLVDTFSRVTQYGGPSRELRSTMEGLVARRAVARCEGRPAREALHCGRSLGPKIGCRIERAGEPAKEPPLCDCPDPAFELPPGNTARLPHHPRRHGPLWTPPAIAARLGPDSERQSDGASRVVETRRYRSGDDEHDRAATFNAAAIPAHEYRSFFGGAIRVTRPS